MSWIRYWLFTGLIFLFFQVVIGGITRLTGSGLSITKWDIVTGTIPPLSDTAWVHEFELYKQTPQYHKINKGMTIEAFKWIYFWEYLHRLWARTMGFVFLIPFIIFYAKRWISPHLLRRLGVVVALAMLAATFGWIMVASGLVDRPWVNAYKLSFHLCIAFSVYTALLWTYLEYRNDAVVAMMGIADKLSFAVLVVLWVQLFLGGIMSGMKAGLFYPTWPDMNGAFIPHIVFHNNIFSVEEWVHYDRTGLAPAVVQVLHRFTAYMLFLLGLALFYKRVFRAGSYAVGLAAKWFFGMLIIQVLLGIITVIMCKGQIPVLWGVLHQAGAVILLTVTLVLRFQIKRSPI
ncbi:MAG: COX15/CtaA family protein [Saprospiraceae bacterium]|nr:COX15/CtaA family protein [Saprospiraceae bacterium]